MSGRFWRVIAASALVAAVMGPVAARPATAASTRVTMAGMKFIPDHLEVQLGDTVMWEAGDDDHTVTARDGSFDSSSRGLMEQGDEYRWRFRTPGQFPYYCRIHGNRGMQGVIVVVDPYAPSTTTSTRPTPATAAATTSTTAAATTTTTVPATTTSRVLATSSTTSLKDLVTTAPAGVPAVPQAPPALNLSAPVVGSGGTDAALPEAQAAARHSGGSSSLPALALGAFAVVAVLGGGGLAVVRRRGAGRRGARRRGSRARRP
jgi:plastocyanin